VSELERGRDAYSRHAWRETYEALVAADRAETLGADDLERVGMAAYLIALEDDSVGFLDRAYQRHVAEERPLRAARCAFWVGLQLVMRGELGPGGGWLGRAQRLVEQQGEETADHGYLLIPLAFQQKAAGNWEPAVETARRAARIAERFRDGDLFAMATQLQGLFLVEHGEMSEGLRLLDEAMLAATSEAESPLVTGIVYCGVIFACVETYEVRRAREWTDVLSRWCAGQPELVAFTGRCLIHRAEILQLGGRWSEALDEAGRASERLAQGFNRPATAQAFYRQGELYRLRGEFPAAERAYRAASRYGFEPQPGLALLRLAQGRSEAAAATIRRALAETSELYRRAGLLPAYVEIMLALGDFEDARAGCVELDRLARTYGSQLLAGAADHAWGALRLAEGDASGALESLRRAARAWQDLEAPYEAARTQTLVGLACRELHDADGAALALEAARDAFSELGAVPDVARLGPLGGPAGEEHGLTARELEVLRLVARGKSNREIATALVISEHTVARHLQNIFAKLDVSSRTAASAFAYEHDLV
jgi:ATP/maltotriose-dependent transcriptional regulator MalT